MVLFIITTILASLILIICIIQFFQIRRVPTLSVPIQRNGGLINPLSTTNASVNT